VDDLKSAHVILDHGINCVIVRRPAWIEQHQDSIAEALRESYRSKGTNPCCLERSRG
jgi:hypothetical protein